MGVGIAIGDVIWVFTRRGAGESLQLQVRVAAGNKASSLVVKTLVTPSNTAQQESKHGFSLAEF